MSNERPVRCKHERYIHEVSYTENGLWWADEEDERDFARWVDETKGGIMTDKDRFEEALDKFIQHNFTYNKDNIKLMFTYEIFTDRYSTIIVARDMKDALAILVDDDPKAVVLCAIDVNYRDEFFRTQNPEDRPY